MKSARANNLSLTADTQYIRKAGTGRCLVTELLESVAAVHLGLSRGTAPLILKFQVPCNTWLQKRGLLWRRDV